MQPFCRFFFLLFPPHESDCVRSDLRNSEAAHVLWLCLFMHHFPLRWGFSKAQDIVWCTTFGYIFFHFPVFLIYFSPIEMSRWHHFFPLIPSCFHLAFVCHINGTKVFRPAQERRLFFYQPMLPLFALAISYWYVFCSFFLLLFPFVFCDFIFEVFFSGIGPCSFCLFGSCFHANRNLVIGVRVYLMSTKNWKGLGGCLFFCFTSFFFLV